MRTSALAAVVLALLGTAAASAPAATIVRDYPMFRTGIALTYGAVIYDPEDGTDPIDLTGFPLVNVTADIEYTPEKGINGFPDEDINSLVIQMLVPVEGAEQEFLELLGSEFVETSTPGTWKYELDTNVYNGTIRGGRWSLTTYSADPITGEPFGTNGTFGDNSAISLVVETPEPATAAVLTGGLLALARRRH